MNIRFYPLFLTGLAVGYSSFIGAMAQHVHTVRADNQAGVQVPLVPVKDKINVLAVVNLLKAYVPHGLDIVSRLEQIGPEQVALLRTLLEQKAAVKDAHYGSWIASALQEKVTAARDIHIFLLTHNSADTCMSDQRYKNALSLSCQLWTLRESGLEIGALATCVQAYAQKLLQLCPQDYEALTNYTKTYKHTITKEQLVFLTQVLFKLDAQDPYGQPLFFGALKVDDAEQIQQAIAVLTDSYNQPT